MAGEALMRARALLAIAVVSVTVGRAHGQTATADGVAALARGDYQRAVAILKPVAEDWRMEDTAAQFFMAGVYEAGQGVPPDTLRACALYMRAAKDFKNLFGQQAGERVRDFIGRGAEFMQQCQALANIGFDSGFEAATFDLGPGHFVDWTLTDATVTYHEKTTRRPMPLGFRGARFLPLRHTELATGPTRSLTRHFIEAFVWIPRSRSGPWELYWHLFEVVRDELVRIDTANPCATVAGGMPPASETFDVRAYAALHVDEQGNAAWAVPNGTHPASGRIQSEDERREVREQQLARDAALKRVDWTRQYDVSRPPAMTYADADGCGEFVVYGWSADRAESTMVRVAGPVLGLSTEPRRFDLSRETVNISIETRVYATPQRGFDFCSDVKVAGEPERVATWRAVSGAIAVQLSAKGVRASAPFLRRATVVLTDLVLRNAAGSTVLIPGPVKLSAIVGGYAG